MAVIPCLPAAALLPLTSIRPTKFLLCRRRLRLRLRLLRSPLFSSASSSGIPVTCSRPEPSLEVVYNVRVERDLSPERMAELGVDRWAVWKSGARSRLPWEWNVDQQVYVVSGEVRVVPEGAKSGERYMKFVAGDLVHYPKWFGADLLFDGPYEERYRFLAPGDD